MALTIILKLRTAIFTAKHEAWGSGGQFPDEHYFQEEQLPPSLIALKTETQLFQYEGNGYNKEDQETVAQSISSILFEQKLYFQNVSSSSYMKSSVLCTSEDLDMRESYPQLS